MAVSKEYARNRERVYDIYGIPKNERGGRWNCHHIVRRSEGGGDNKGNLFPVLRPIHRLMDGHCQDCKRNWKMHEFIERKYGRDPYK